MCVSSPVQWRAGTAHNPAPSGTDINGRPLGTLATGELLTDIALSPDGRAAVIGGFGKRVRIVALPHLAVAHAFPACSSSIRSVAIARGGAEVLAGTADGELVMYRSAGAAPST